MRNSEEYKKFHEEMASMQDARQILKKLRDECGELIHAITDNNEEEIKEEIADVILMIDRVLTKFPELNDHITQYMMEKIKRTLKRKEQDVL